MASCPGVKKQTQLVVFLPVPAAQVIDARLQEHGHSSRAVQSIPELVDALHSCVASIVVTARPEIDVVRNIKPVSVLNIEVFFHAVGSSHCNGP